MRHSTGIKLFIGAVVLGHVLAAGCGGRAPSGGELAEIERVGSFTGIIEVAYPDGKTGRLSPGQEQIFFLPGTRIAVIEGECVAYLGGTKVILSRGHSARVIPPLTVIDSIIAHSGSFRAFLPDASEILVAAGEEIPSLPAGTLILVAEGEVMIFSRGSRLALSRGEVGRLDRALERGARQPVPSPTALRPVILSGAAGLVGPTPLSASPYLPD